MQKKKKRRNRRERGEEGARERDRQTWSRKESDWRQKAEEEKVEEGI